MPRRELTTLDQDEYVAQLATLLTEAGQKTLEAWHAVSAVTDFGHNNTINGMEPRDRPSILSDAISQAHQAAGEAMMQIAAVERLVNFFTVEGD